LVIRPCFLVENYRERRIAGQGKRSVKRFRLQAFSL